MSLSVLAFLVSIGTVAGLLKLGTSAIDANTVSEQADETITPVVSSDELTIELADEPVFAVLPVEVSVEQATEAGYTLTAYTDNTDLVSTTDSSKVIPMIAVDEGELAALTDNTYGLALAEPASQDEEVFTTLSTDADNPTFITDKNYEKTEANDTTTIYYGFYITPDTPYGTYTSGDVYYDVEENKGKKVTYNGNGLNFSNGRKTNIVKYEAIVTENTEKYSHTPNISDTGVVSGSVGFSVHTNEIVTIPDAAKLHIKYTYGGGVVRDGQDDGNSFGSFWQGSHADFTPLANYSAGIQNCGGGTVADGRYYTNNGTGPVTVECDVVGDTVTFGYWTNSGGPSSWNPDYGYYAVVTGYDADGNVIYLNSYNPVSGEYVEPNHSESEAFLGWSTDQNTISPDYTTENEITKDLIPTAENNITLYAVWSPIVDIVYNGNNATAGSMESTSYDGDTPTTVTLAHEDVIVGNTINLYAPNYKKTGYGFAGWSTDSNAWNDLTDTDEGNNPTIYGPNETFTMTKDMALAAEDGNVNLYAVWVPAEKNNGTPVTLQGWTGCGNLTATTYDAETGKFNVGANTLTALTDSRDGEVYTVARLADGNCWTVENLRMANTHIENGQSTTTVIATNNTNNPLNVGGNVTIINNDNTATNHLSPTNNSWCTNTQEACLNQSYLNTNNININGEGMVASYNGGGTTSQWYSYGNNYNWYSATAGRGTQSVASGTAEGDICPTGWHLPYGGSSTDEKGGNTSGGFYFLNGKIGADTNSWRSFPNNFVYSGGWYGSSAGGRGNSGYYWSSTASSSDYAYSLDLYSSGVYPGSSDNKNYGGSVRCVAPVQ